MRKFAFALLSTVALGSVTAQAADLATIRMPMKAPAIAQVGNWTGFYIGGNLGYGWGKYDASNATGTIVTTNGGSSPYGFNAASGNGNGVTAGVQAGYNWQVEQAVLGIEADWQYLGSKVAAGNSAIAVPAFIGGNFSGNASVSTDWYATFRGRVGYAFGPALLYATGGIALAETKLSENATGSILTALFPPTLGPLGSHARFWKQHPSGLRGWGRSRICTGGRLVRQGGVSAHGVRHERL
ncbi:outer membrane immunogenic protein [Bradyrhizobium sp. LM6.11]